MYVSYTSKKGIFQWEIGSISCDAVYRNTEYRYYSRSARSTVEVRTKT